MEHFDDSGIHYWIDVKNNMVGKTVNPTLAENIYNSMVFLFVCSKNSVVSDNVRKELDVAATYKKPIITFDCDGSYLNTNVVMHTVSPGRIEFSGNLNSDIMKLVETIKQYKKELEERKKREEQAKKKKEAIKEIKQLAIEYRTHSLHQDTIIQQLYEKNQLIGNETKDCPICKKSGPIDASFCETCGFQFPQLYAIDGNERYPLDKRHLALAKTNYDSFALVKDEKDNLEKKVGELEKQKKGLEAELEKVKSQIASDSVQQDLIIPVKDLSIVMKPVEGGIFWMGAQNTDSNGQNYDDEAYDNESPVHRVKLESFYMGETVVTQALWKVVMGDNPSYFEGDTLPVERVSWNDCKKFINELNRLTSKNFRLPTEAEWEYAARGGKKSKGYKYSGSNTIDDVAWYEENSEGKTHAVKTKSFNELGIYDMSGNVWEWCQDWYGYYSGSSQTDPKGPSNGLYRVLRSGDWSERARYCRGSYRSYRDLSSKSIGIGFRLVLPQ